MTAAHLQKGLGLARRLEQRLAVAVGDDIVLAAVGDEHRGFHILEVSTGVVVEARQQLHRQERIDFGPKVWHRDEDGGKHQRPGLLA